MITSVAELNALTFTRLVLKPGDIAPDIDALASSGARFRLSEQSSALGTVIFFFPKAFTPGCTIETKSFRDNYAEIRLAGASLVGISADDHDRQCLFAESVHAPFPMIGDADRTICKAYGVLWPILELAMRVTFIVNKMQRIEAVLHHELAIGRHRDEVLRIMDAMRAKAALPKALPDASIEGFELIEEIGAGAAGAVFRAREIANDRTVAVKLLAAGWEAARFEREANVLSRLEHPNIVRYVAHGIASDGRAYMAMEWLDGVTLSNKLRGAAKLDVRESIRIARDVASALAAAHASGVIHRDVTPNNVMLTKDDVKLIDFGVARADEKLAATLTRTGRIVDTPGFMAPEQASGGKVDARTDLFALGCVLFRCLTGRAPWFGPDWMTTMEKVATEPAPHIEISDAPSDLDALVQELLAKNVDARPPTADAVRERLNALL